MSEPERRSVLVEMQRLGWKPKTGGKACSGFSKPYVRFMFALAKNTGATDYWKLRYKGALCAFVKTETGIDNPEWLTYAQASPLPN